jgi:hypothetical protein
LPSGSALTAAINATLGVKPTKYRANSSKYVCTASAHDRISGSPQMVRVWDEFSIDADFAGHAAQEQTSSA